MLVAFDTRPLQNQSASRGIGMYTSHLLKYLRKIPNLEITEINQGQIPNSVDLVHYPWFDLYFPTLPLSKPKPTVVTIHDVTPLVLKDLYPPGIKGRINYWKQKISLRGVSAVITDSNTSAKDIHQHLNVPINKIHTVYLAPQEKLNNNPNQDQIHKVKRKYQLPSNYVLYVGDLNNNKNVITLIKAVKNTKYTLVIVGKQATQTKYDHSHPENRDLDLLQTKYSSDPKVKILGFVPSEELGILYNQALVYCQPSLYEGFGLPVLEAMQSGCPVLASKNGSLPEIGGHPAIYTPPTVDKLSQGIEFIAKLSQPQRTRLIQEGKKQASQYTWQKTATQVSQIYQQIISQTKN